MYNYLSAKKLGQTKIFTLFFCHISASSNKKTLTKSKTQKQQPHSSGSKRTRRVNFIPF
jgi:hypothetical protein